jgi:hypothetical protein
MAKYRKKTETQEQKQVLSIGGNEYDVTGENGKYYFCGDTQFRKVNPNIHVYYIDMQVTTPDECGDKQDGEQ